MGHLIDEKSTLLLIDSTKTLALPRPSTHSKRNDIQGLRAFAIVSVLIFHLKPLWLPYGYMGVDIFFVISGFLMAMLLSAKGQITWYVALDFYYRRLRRIMPLYLLVIFGTLFTAVHLVEPMDREDVINDAYGALGLYSNIQPLFEKVTYFQLTTKYKYFVHTWSLSVEIQFYLFVPLIFTVLYHLKWESRYMLCSAIGVVSFLAQSLAPPLYEHGFTPLRFWQFMIGIMVYYWSSQADNEEILIQKQQKSPMLQRIDLLTDHLNIILWLIAVTTPMFLDDEWIPVVLARLYFTLMAGLVLKIGATSMSNIMTNPICMWVGDHSYTIYLVHWPIIIYWRYLSGSSNLEVFEVLIITILSLLATFLVDYSMEVIMSRLKTKNQSMVFILFIFLLCQPVLRYLSNTATSKNNISVYDEYEIRELVEKYYNNEEINLTDKEALRINGLLYPYARHFKGCNDPVGLNASRMKKGLRSMDVCREEGNGTKKILVIGNSLARHSFVGIAHHFRSVYSLLMLHSIQNCSPFKLDPKSDEKSCTAYIDTLENAFREFEPDIVFIIYRFPETSARFKGDNDTILRGMKWLYSLADKHASEMVFVPAVELRFRVFQPYSDILDALRVGKPLEKFRISQKVYYEKNRPHHWTRIKKANCSKCVLMDWSLPTLKDGKIYSVDLNTKLTYFIDRLHVSDIGSYQQGRMLRQLYDNQTQSEKPVKEVYRVN